MVQVTNIRYAAPIVRFSNPIYEVTFNSVGESDYCTTNFTHPKLVNPNLEEIETSTVCDSV